MSKKRPRTPKLRHHKATGKGCVVLDGKTIYLGKYELPETNEKYHRLISEWLAGALPVAGEDITVIELIKSYWKHAKEYYRRPDGSPTSELDSIRQALRHVNDRYGRTPANQFGPKALKTVRQQMIDAGNCRGYINALVDRERRMFKWGVPFGKLEFRGYTCDPTYGG